MESEEKTAAAAEPEEPRQTGATVQEAGAEARPADAAPAKPAAPEQSAAAPGGGEDPKNGERPKTGEEKQSPDSMLDFIARDVARFRREYPDVSLELLDGDIVFQRFCGSRYGREPLSTLYRDYCQIMELSAQKTPKQPAPEAPDKPQEESKTPELTKEQRRRLDEWNALYPQMQMSAEEFLQRN